MFEEEKLNSNQIFELKFPSNNENTNENYNFENMNLNFSNVFLQNFYKKNFKNTTLNNSFSNFSNLSKYLNNSHRNKLYFEEKKTMNIKIYEKKLIYLK